ncbi:cysteine desulfurase family protein [Pallidibacillus thermolactis]|uniref:cysteine desulfurase family protein n=1 Tax=Pallidibacillus thermolactis TaxID=251051 RepID=UPI00156B3DDA|nr:cysteine desulfurase family protein [Pallidibacillus thermolactis]MED1673634.1 cysteine desulfurase family protein [Pallidibacillus thermolactis subsp. kokeshiiformis]
MNKYYADYAATSPIHPDVVEEMTEVMHHIYGNPSSIHAYGREARKIIDEARNVIAKSIHANFNEIIFTSGGTEADNMALIGTAYANKDKGKHIITTAIEHHAVLHTCEFLEQNGFEVTYLPVDKTGRVSVEDVKNALRDDTILVSVMFANNEVGTIQPIAEIGQLLSEHQAYFHTDAVQAYGLLPIDVKKMHIDLLSVSAHKINGPKGIGFLYENTGVRLQPYFYGGEQERKRRAGTENVPGIAGFKKAVEIIQKDRQKKYDFYEQLREKFIQRLKEESINFKINGSESNYLPHIINVSFPGTDVEAFLVNLDLEGISASSGSACTAGSLEPSHVLRAMYGSESDELFNSIRFSFGLGVTLEDVEDIAKITAKVVKRLTD